MPQESPGHRLAGAGVVARQRIWASGTMLRSAQMFLHCASCSSGRLAPHRLHQGHTCGHGPQQEGPAGVDSGTSGCGRRPQALGSVGNSKDPQGPSNPDMGPMMAGPVSHTDSRPPEHGSTRSGGLAGIFRTGAEARRTMGWTPREGGPGAHSEAERFPAVPKAPRDSGRGFPGLVPSVGPQPVRGDPRALLKLRGSLMHPSTLHSVPVPGPAPGYSHQPPTLPRKPLWTCK